MAIEHVRHRVLPGGHDIPEKDIRRRFERSWENFNTHYKPLADAWTVYDSSGEEMTILDQSEESL